MTQQNVPVDARTAQSLAAHASVRGKRLVALINEILDAALHVYSEGGTADEIFPAWKALRMSRGLNGSPFVPRSLIGEMVERIYREDREWILGLWFEGGKELGNRIRTFYPTIEEIPAAVAGVHPLFAERRIDVSRGPAEEVRRGTIHVRVAAELPAALTACMERLIAGLLSAYAFRIAGSRIADGTIEIAAQYEGRGPVPGLAHPGQAKGASPRATH